MTAGWLPQREPGMDAILLRAHPGAVVCVACDNCSRFRWDVLATLIRRYGPAASLPGVLAALSTDCPRRIADKPYDQCGAFFADLGGRRPGGSG